MIKEPKIIFHHIPKCGGTSIVTGLVLTYYPLRLLRYGRKGFAHHLNAQAAEKAAQDAGVERYTFRRQLLSYAVHKGDCPLISGHYPFHHEIYEACKGEWSFVTLLRDPVKRFYSEYLWNRYKDHEYQRTALDIEAYMESEQGLMTARSFVNCLARSKTPTGTPTDGEVREAIETLPKMRVIGSLEHMERFRADMGAAFGRKPFFLTRNSSPAPEDKKPLPDKESAVYKKILDLTAADREIYREALKLIGV